MADKQTRAFLLYATDQVWFRMLNSFIVIDMKNPVGEAMLLSPNCGMLEGISGEVEKMCKVWTLAREQAKTSDRDRH